MTLEFYVDFLHPNLVDYERTYLLFFFGLESRHALVLRCPTPSFHDDLELSNDLGFLRRISALLSRHIAPSLSASNV